MNNDYGRHIRRTWVDTHSQCIRTDPEIYLPGEFDAKEEDESDGNNEGEPVDMSIGTKRKADSRTRSDILTKVAKTTARGGPSTAALGAIDERRPDITLIDVPVDEDLLVHPYGRHGCLYIEVKVDADKKPNPQEAVSVPFRAVTSYQIIPLDSSKGSQARKIKAHTKLPKIR